MSKLKIHIVEDEIVIAYDLQDMLEDLGYIVNDISMSFDELINTKIKTDDSDLFILDINLKGRESGFDIGNVLYEMGKPFIYMSSNVDKLALEQAREHILVEKPFNIDDIDKALISLVKKEKQ